MSEQCSEIFEDVFHSRCGGCERQCECGIVHFDSYNFADWDDGELEELQKRAKKEPEKYVEHDHSVSTLSIGGQEIVCGCTCENAHRYENFILSHASQLAEYLNKRSEKLKKEAETCVVEEPKGG